MEKFFHAPVQVKFWDGEHYSYGIAFEDRIICACCGAVFEIKELYETREDKPEEEIIICYDTWVPFGEFIGDEDEE